MHSIIIPGDALANPEELDWVAEFSHGIGDEPAEFDVQLGLVANATGAASTYEQLYTPGEGMDVPPPAAPAGKKK